VGLGSIFLYPMVTVGTVLEMGRSSADAEVRPKNSAEYSARFGSATCDYSAEVQPNFGKHSASFVASHLRRFALATGVNSTKVNILTLSY